MSVFDNLLDDQDTHKVKSKPYFKEKDKKASDKLKWLKQVSMDLLKAYSERHHKLKSNLAAYRGISRKQARSNYRNSERVPTNRTERFTINHLHDITETKVAQMTRLKPAIQIVPTNDEFSDRQASRATKMLMDHLWYINDIDGMLQSIHRHKKIFGEAYLFIEWDEKKGDKHP